MGVIVYQFIFPAETLDVTMSAIYHILIGGCNRKVLFMFGLIEVIFISDANYSKK